MRKSLVGIVTFISTVLFCHPVIAQAQFMNGIAIKISSVSQNGDITVDVANKSEKTVRLWDESNSWGSGRWRILVVRKGRLQTFFQNPAQNFTQNLPTFREISPRASITKKLNPNDDEWCNLGCCRSADKTEPVCGKVSFGQGDLIIVVYDVPPFPEYLRRAVWYGVVASSSSVL